MGRSERARSATQVSKPDMPGSMMSTMATSAAMRVEERDAHLARRGVVDVEALALEHQAQRGADVVVVLDDQDARHAVSFAQTPH